MNIIGKVESLWRYPVKSMAGEELADAFVGFAGVYGDRFFAFKSAASPIGFPYLTGREKAQMLLYRPRFRIPDKAVAPPNLAEAEGLAPGVTPVFAEPADLIVDVETPSGQVIAVDDPALMGLIGEGLDAEHSLSLMRSERAMTDCRPVSLFSMATRQQLSDELGIDLDKRRFRANIYMDLEGNAGFAEDAFIGKTLKFGTKAVVSVLERDPRCHMITLDPDTAEANPKVLRKVVKAHKGMAGVYAAVIVEGTIRPGDVIELLN